MKNAVLSFLFVFIGKIFLACPLAHQNRLFPLGLCAEGFVFVETHMQRVSDPNGNKYEMSSAWYGKSFLMVYNKGYKLLKSVVIDSLNIGDSLKETGFIKMSFDKGLLLAKQLKEFVIARPFYFSYCDFRQNCNEIKLDISQNKIYLELKDGRRKEISVLKDTLSIAGNYLGYYKNFNGGIIDYKKIFISSVRKFRVGEKIITVVHLASGQEETRDGKTYPPGTEYEPKFVFNQPDKSVFYEPLLYHGHGFDFFMTD